MMTNEVKATGIVLVLNILWFSMVGVWYVHEKEEWTASNMALLSACQEELVETKAELWEARETQLLPRQLECR